MDNEYYYNQARSRYNNACSEINNCENRVNELIGEKNEAIDYLNSLNANLVRHRDASEDLANVIAQETDLTSSLNSVSTNMDEASTSFTQMADAPDSSSVNINDGFSDEMTTTRNTLTEAMSTFRTKKSAVDTRITELEAEIRATETRISDIEQAIRITRANADAWRSTKSSASMDMEYYRRRMDAED